MARAAHPISIVCDNQEVVRRLAELVELRHEDSPCPVLDRENPLWRVAWQHLRVAPERFFHTQWCPSHLLDPGKEAELDSFLGEGGDITLLKGNRSADILAAK